MGVARNSSRYPAERAVLDQALAMGGLNYTLPSPGQATAFRQRAYYFRTLLHKEMNIAAGHRLVGTPYDAIRMVIKPEAPCVVTITLDTPAGIITPLSGGVIVPPLAPETDPLLLEAIETRKRLLGEKK